MARRAGVEFDAILLVHWFQGSEVLREPDMPPAGLLGDLQAMPLASLLLAAHDTYTLLTEAEIMEAMYDKTPKERMIALILEGNRRELCSKISQVEAHLRPCLELVTQQQLRCNHMLSDVHEHLPDVLFLARKCQDQSLDFDAERRDLKQRLERSEEERRDLEQRLQRAEKAIRDQLHQQQLAEEERDTARTLLEKVLDQVKEPAVPVLLQSVPLTSLNANALPDNAAGSRGGLDNSSTSGESVSTDAQSLISTAHARMRSQQRDIDRDEVKTAVKQGKQFPGRNGCFMIVNNRKVFVLDQTLKVKITMYRLKMKGDRAKIVHHPKNALNHLIVTIDSYEEEHGHYVVLLPGGVRDRIPLRCIGNVSWRGLALGGGPSHA